ncbi:MAG: hypothetical protein EPN97_13975 [Alphaproteobacteria bacterium]|nr:MAG: hypothetical protein EPN97_13975 [Alphaproteobacteria bacterium]
MPLKVDFNKDYVAVKDADAVLSVRYNAGGYGNNLIYDFNARVMISRASNGGVSVTPFSQLDRETLVEMRDKLVELRGNPPELPPEAPAAQPSAKKFNL